MNEPMDLQGRTVIVTGAAQGIGKAIADQVLALGGSVAALDVDIAHIAETATLRPFRCDVSDPDDVAAAVAAAEDALGAIDGLVNNAGISRPALIDRMAQTDWDKVIAVNLTGSFLMMQAVGRRMIAAAKEGQPRHSAIVNVASDAGRRGTIGQVNYGSAKAGVIGMAMSAAREWARFGIRVNAVSFGVVDTPMTETIRQDKFRDTYLQQIPLGRFGSAEEVAAPAVFLLSQAASYITGQTLSVNGGYHIAG